MEPGAVPLRTKIAYGMGELGLSLQNESLVRFLMFFYTDTLRVSPTAVGLVMLLGKGWDAITDPGRGYVSDATRSRWGRRRPYILFGALPMGICYALLFSPPALSDHALLGYMLGLSLALYTCFTIVAVPYYAWGAELARHYHERTAVVQVRPLLGLFGGVAVGGLVAVIFVPHGDPQQGCGVMGLRASAVKQARTVLC